MPHHGVRKIEMSTGIMEQKVRVLSKEQLQDILLKLEDVLSEEQCRELSKLLDEYVGMGSEAGRAELPVRMSQEFVDEKLEQLKRWMQQIQLLGQGLDHQLL